MDLYMDLRANCQSGRGKTGDGMKCLFETWGIGSITFLRNQRAIRRLRTQCERAKRQLSTQTSVTIEFEPEKKIVAPQRRANRFCSNAPGNCQSWSTLVAVSLEKPLRVDSLHEGADFSLRLSRAKFEELCHSADFTSCPG